MVNWSFCAIKRRLCKYTNCVGEAEIQWAQRGHKRRKIDLLFCDKTMRLNIFIGIFNWIEQGNNVFSGNQQIFYILMQGSNNHPVCLSTHAE